MKCLQGFCDFNINAKCGLSEKERTIEKCPRMNPFPVATKKSDPLGSTVMPGSSAVTTVSAERNQFTWKNGDHTYKCNTCGVVKVLPVHKHCHGCGREVKR